MKRFATPLVLVTVAFALVRLLSLPLVAQPGYTDAYYYANVAARLAHGQGLTVDFVWSFIEAPDLAPLPVASHRFWMPLATVVQAVGIVILGPLVGDFRAGQIPLVIIACLLVPLAYALARALGTSDRAALAAAAIVGAGGVFAPAWVTADAFALAAALGASFFLLYRRAAAGSVRDGALAGLAVGLLYLARAEAALFGLALLALALRPATRRAGLAGTAVALLIGVAWLARDLTAGPTESLIGRSALITRYDEFFALAPPDPARLLADPGAFLATRAGALLANAGRAVAVLLLFLLPPLALGVHAAWRRPEVRAFAGLAVAVYVAESLAFPLHSVRGSYDHSLATFFPMAVALSAAGADGFFSPRAARIAIVAAVTAFGLVGAIALSQWDATFNGVYRDRVASLASIPPGPFMAIDAAAWRWISGRTVLVTPSEGAAAASCVAAAYGASTIVLEPAHFAAYDALYRGPGISIVTSDRTLCPPRAVAAR